MKKLFTLACGALLAMGASAADFGFCDKDGKLYEDGAVVTVGYEYDELMPGLSTYKMESGVYYIGNEGVSYTVDAIISAEYQSAWRFVTCCAFGQCMPFSNGTYTNSGNATGTVEPLQLHYEMQYSPEPQKPTEDAVVNVTLYKKNNPSDKKSITVNFIAKPAEEVAGIASVGADLNAPVQYFNILGVEVKNPQKGQLLIRRQGNTAQKVIF